MPAPYTLEAYTVDTIAKDLNIAVKELIGKRRAAENVGKNTPPDKLVSWP